MGRQAFTRYVQEENVTWAGVIKDAHTGNAITPGTITPWSRLSMAFTRNLPSLSSVRSFEAAARHGSFTLAADELAVTQSAVSLQVRKLEAYLGKKLFVRQSRKVELTADGIQYFEACRRVLSDLENATRQMLDRDRNEVLIVSTIPTIGQLWLMPRLASFTATHRHIEVRVVSDIRPLDMQADGVDIAIRVGPLAGRQYPRGRYLNRPDPGAALGWHWRRLPVRRLRRCP